MASQKKSAFLTEHYDKLVLAAALAVLVGSLVALLVSAGSNKADAAKFRRRVQTLETTERRNVEVVPGFMEDECKTMFQEFFRMVRSNARKKKSGFTPPA